MNEKKRNEPAPNIGNSIQNELTKIGGRIPYGFGKYSGQPVLKLAWGMAEMAFECGKERIRFYDQNVQPIFVARNYCVSANALHHLNDWYKLRQSQMVKAYQSGQITRVRPDNSWLDIYHTFLFAPASSYLKRFCSPADYWLLPETASSEETAKLLPEGYYFFSDIPEVTEIGCENFFVLQWVPPFEICSKKQWEQERFGISPVIDLNGSDCWVDILGEYPKYGAYWNVLLKIENEKGGYARPEFQNTIEPLQRMIQEAQKAKKDAQAQTKINVQQRYENAIALEAEKHKISREKLTEKIHEEGQIIIRGSKARIFPKENKTNWGKPKEIIKGK